MVGLPELANFFVHGVQVCGCLLLAYGAYVAIVQARREDRAAPPPRTGVNWTGLRTFAGAE